MSGDRDRSGDDTVIAATTLTGGHAPTTVAGRYEILGLLGVGGMGSVYRARDTELDEIVALKMLRHELVSLPGILDRFKREVKLARRVTHKNVARTFDIGEHEGEKYLTMELVEGESLGALLERHGALTVEKIVALVAPMCEGLAAAHAAGVVHRDLKPDNVLLAADGRVVITDFGIARGFDAGSSTATMGEAIGTPAYMAPEQVEGVAEVDARADLYALGVILYEMATGQRPFKAGSALGEAMARLTSAAPDPQLARPDLPDALAQVIRRCLERKREQRYASAGDVASALAAITRPSVSASAITGPLATATPFPVSDASGKTVAVLPFRNGGPPEDDYLADGLTDDLIDTLSMARSLRVRSRGAVVQLKGVDRDPRQLGRELDVQVVVEGSVRRGAAGQLRIATRLISVADGFQLWARRFDRPLAEVLQVGDEAARAIAEALTVDGALTNRAPMDPEALDLYLRARHQAHQFDRLHVEQAVGLLEQALVRAPDDPLILSTYALARTRLGFFGGSDGKRSTELARAAAERAAKMAPDRAEPRAALGSLRFQSSDAAGAVRELRHALLIAPSLVDAHDILGRICGEVGRLDLAERHLGMALSLEPGMLGAVADLARVAALRGQWDRVDLLLSGPNPHGDAMARMQGAMRLALWRGDETRILASLTSPGLLKLPVAMLLTDLVRTRRLPVQPLSPLGEIDDSPDEGRRRRSFFQQLYAEGASYIGEIPFALDAIDRAIGAGLIDISWMDHCPLLQLVRDEPRFVGQRALVAARIAPILAALDERI